MKTDAYRCDCVCVCAGAYMLVRAPFHTYSPKHSIRSGYACIHNTHQWKRPLNLKSCEIVGCFFFFQKSECKKELFLFTLFCRFAINIIIIIRSFIHSFCDPNRNLRREVFVVMFLVPFNCARVLIIFVKSALRWRWAKQKRRPNGKATGERPQTNIWEREEKKGGRHFSSNIASVLSLSLFILNNLNAV